MKGKENQLWGEKREILPTVSVSQKGKGGKAGTGKISSGFFKVALEKGRCRGKGGAMGRKVHDHEKGKHAGAEVGPNCKKRELQLGKGGGSLQRLVSGKKKSFSTGSEKKRKGWNLQGIRAPRKAGMTKEKKGG